MTNSNNNNNNDNSNNNRLTIYTRDRAAKYWNLLDAYGAAISTGENGFKTASFKLPRNRFGYDHEDIALNDQVFFFGPRGDKAWHGRIDTITARQDRGLASLEVQATGYWAALYDTFYTGTLSASATPEAMLATLIPTVTNLANDTSGLAATGLTGRAYQTPNGGTDYVPVGDVVLEICKMGTSSSGDRVIPLVLADRKLITRILTADPAVAYTVSRADLSSITLDRALSAVYNRVYMRYKSSTDNTLQVVTVEDTTQQSNVGIDFTGGGSVTSLVRSTLRDITGLSATTAAIATTTANSLLNQTKRARNEPQTIVIDRDMVVRDATLNQEIPNWQVQAGYWIQIPDLFDRPSDLANNGIGTAVGDEKLQTMFYISETSYDCDTGRLTLRPGAGSALLTTNAEGGSF